MLGDNPDDSKSLISSQEWRWRLRPKDVFFRPWAWKPISRDEAAMLERGSPVIVVSRGNGIEYATWFDQHSPFLRGDSPYDLKALLYYRYVGEEPIQYGPIPSATNAPASSEIPASDDIPPEVVPSSVPPVQAATWIAIEVVDDSGDPVPSELVRIELSNGSIREVELSAEGRARLENIASGLCKVSFPNLAAKTWRAA